MVRIGHYNLSERPGIVAVIDSKVLMTAIRAKEMGAHILEVRVDLTGIRAAYELTHFLNELKDKVRLPLIVTNRCPNEGGQWDGSEEDRIKLLVSALPTADAVDVELSAPLRSQIIEAVKDAGKTLIISSHDFTATPSHTAMLATLNRAKAAGADIAKLAVTPNNNVDVLCLLQVTAQVDFPVCTIAMGRLGRYTRVVAPIYGSVLTYGSVDDAVAPGQLRIDELKHMLEVLV
jgi:3-dehydroquinate dehydratase-1